MYGFPGTHKTTIAGEIAATSKRRALYIGLERGSAPFATRPDIRKFIDAGNLDILEIDPLAPNALAQIDATVNEVASEDFGYDFVILDPLDVAQDVAEKVFKKKYEGSKNTFGVYGELGEWTDTIVRRLHNSPNFTAIFLSHAKEQSEESGAYRLLPKLSGSSKDAIGGLPDLVIYLGYDKHPETGESHLIAVTGNSEKHITKSRYSHPHFIVDPTGQKIWDGIESAINPTTKKAAA